MKTKHKSCISVGAASGEKMKSVILYPYGPLTGGTRCCRMLHAKNLAITSAIYTIVSAATTTTCIESRYPRQLVINLTPQFHGAYAQCHCKPLSVCTSKFTPRPSLRLLLLLFPFMSAVVVGPIWHASL